MPHICPEIFEQIGADESVTTWEASKVRHALKADVTVHKGRVLFPRIDIEKELEELEAMNKPQRELPAEPMKEITDFDNFAKLDLRAVKVLSCERVPKSDKLLKFIVDDGFGERQVLSGIAKYYDPKELVGKTLGMIINLAPRKMMGLESNGMIMSVRDGDKFRVVEFGDDIKAGADIS
jgi:methionyl-tRNA synthetase